MSHPARTLAVALPVLLLAYATFADDDPGARAKTLVGELSSARASASTSAIVAAPSSADAGADAEPPRAPAIVAADDAIAEAKKALARADELRGLGDTTNARLAEESALEWAETARDLVLAVEAERQADDIATKAVAESSHAERARVMLEEAIARRGRLQSTLDALDKELAARPLASAKPSGKPAPKAKGGGK